MCCTQSSMFCNSDSLQWILWLLLLKISTRNENEYDDGHNNDDAHNFAVEMYGQATNKCQSKIYLFIYCIKQKKCSFPHFILFRSEVHKWRRLLFSS